MPTPPATPDPVAEAVRMMTVKVRDNAAEGRLWGTSWNGTAIIRTVTIRAVCPKCGGPRGEPQGLNFHVDGDWHHVNTWTNPCGHVDMYESVIIEAARLAAETTVDGPADPTEQSAANPDPLMQFREYDGHLYTPLGYTVTCDGCRTHLPAPLKEADQVFPVKRPELWPPDTYFVVCPPTPDGRHPCLAAAEVAEQRDVPDGPDCLCHNCQVRFHGRRPIIPPIGA